jgi:hypothetical protein
VEAALRASADKKAAQIFYPTTGLVFYSVEEAYLGGFGFGIRYGSSNINSGNKYKTKQIIECGNAVCPQSI